MIKVKDLKKNYHNKAALKEITFNVEAGDIFGFVGPNGAGKTTTVKILTGQLLPSSGGAQIMGNDVVRERLKSQPYMGVVPENTNLYERLTVAQNLEFFCRLYQSDFKMIDEYLEQVGLLNEKKTQVKKLSKGMKQKVLIIRALLHKPRVLFLDEPTSGLDPASADNIHQMLRKLNQEGMTIFLTSHNMEEVDKLCHRVAFIDSGLIAAMGTPEELKLKFNTGGIKVLVDINGALEERYLDLQGEESAKLISRWIAEGSVKAIHSCEPSLTEIFVKVTGREFV